MGRKPKKKAQPSPASAATGPGAALVNLRWQKTTPEQRSEAARKAAQARWNNHKRDKHADDES